MAPRKVLGNMRYAASITSVGLEHYVHSECSATYASASEAELPPQAMAAHALGAAAQHAAGVSGAIVCTGSCASHLSFAALLSEDGTPVIVWRGPQPRLGADELRGMAPPPAASDDERALRERLLAVGVAEADIRIEPPPTHGAGTCTVPPLAWFALDAAETAQETQRLLQAVACRLVPGGIIAVRAWVLGVDDVSRSLRGVVAEGLFDFMAFNSDRLAPFLQINGRIYLTTPDYRARFFLASKNYLTSSVGAYTDDTKTLLWGHTVVSHSLPDDQTGSLTPAKEDTILRMIVDALAAGAA